MLFGRRGDLAHEPCEPRDPLPCSTSQIQFDITGSAIMRLLPRFRRKHDAASNREGCGYWLVASVASLLLLCVNLAIVQIAYQLLTPLWGDVLQKPRVAQATVLIAPALLIFIEWWLWEAFVEWLIRRKRNSEKRRRV